MPPSGKVIHVNFRGPRKPASGGFGGGKRFVAVVFTVALVAELALVAWVAPGWITSAFFAPTIALVAVLVAVGARRLRTRWEIARLSRKVRSQPPDRDTDSTHHTLH